MANELWIYDAIGADFFGEGFTAADTRDLLADANKDEPLALRINSPGGDVFEAAAIATQLSQWPAGYSARVDGVAASAASYLAAGAGTVEIADGAMMMVHNPWGHGVGDAAEMRATADLLDKLTGTLNAAYVRKTGQETETVAQAMADETWFTAEEAVSFGLADSVLEVKAAAYAIPAVFGYLHAPATDERPAANARALRMARQAQLDKLPKLGTK